MTKPALPSSVPNTIKVSLRQLGRKTCIDLPNGTRHCGKPASVSKPMMGYIELPPEFVRVLQKGAIAAEFHPDGREDSEALHLQLEFGESPTPPPVATGLLGNGKFRA